MAWSSGIEQAAFPIATRRQVHRIRVLGVHESSFGVEARVTAQLGEARITFFELYFALKADRYRPLGAAVLSMREMPYSGLV